jgi:hypothetical protein
MKSGTETRTTEPVFGGYDELIARQKITVEPSRIHISPLELPLTLDGPIEVVVALGRKERGMLGDAYHVITIPPLLFEQRGDEKSARALYKKVLSDLRNPNQTFILSPRLSYDSE